MTLTDGLDLENKPKESKWDWAILMDPQPKKRKVEGSPSFQGCT